MRDSQAMIASEVDHGTSIQDLQNLGRIMLEVKGTVEGLKFNGQGLLAAPELRSPGTRAAGRRRRRLPPVTVRHRDDCWALSCCPASRCSVAVPGTEACSLRDREESLGVAPSVSNDQGSARTSAIVPYAIPDM